VDFVRLFDETVLQVLQIFSEHVVIQIFGLNPIVRSPVHQPAQRNVRAVVLHLSPQHGPGWTEDPVLALQAWRVVAVHGPANLGAEIGPGLG